MPQTGQEPPEKAEMAREWGEIIPVNTSEVVCSTAFLSQQKYLYEGEQP